MIGDLAGTVAVRRRILQILFPLLLPLPWRANFKQMARWSGRNEGTVHNWFRVDLELVDFQRSLIDKFGSGSYCVIFDPCYLLKSGKHSPERYGLRFQIEFIFRDAKQFAGLSHCQSTNKTKLENHFNLALGAVSVAKAAHWLPIDEEDRGPFSMAELKTYYHNLALVERFSIALNFNPTEIKNNPKIKEILFSTTYVPLAA